MSAPPTLRACALLALLAGLLLARPAQANDIPPKPDRYFNDYAHVVGPRVGNQLNRELENFERQTSNQIVVAVYPSLQTDDALDDFCYRTAQSWGVGQKGKDNGAVLFVFVNDHKMNIQTGYGLEGSLPDVTCVRIEDDTMAPYFKRGDYAGGLRAGINAMIAATKGEYKGNGSTDADRQAVGSGSGWTGSIFPILFFLLWIFLFIRRTRGVVYGSSGSGFFGGMLLGSMMNSGGGWSSGGGGWSSGGGGGGGGDFGGGGGFSGGGGSFGGGGASGSW
jgi:uncharacterized protein